MSRRYASAREMGDWLRAPWMGSCPLRFRVFRMWGSGRGRVELWVASPLIEAAGLDSVILPGTGRRQITVPMFTAVAATRREALNYAVHGRQPRLLEEVYPAWCGLREGCGNDA